MEAILPSVNTPATDTAVSVEQNNAHRDTAESDEAAEEPHPHIVPDAMMEGVMPHVTVPSADAPFATERDTEATLLSAGTPAPDAVEEKQLTEACADSEKEAPLLSVGVVVNHLVAEEQIEEAIAEVDTTADLFPLGAVMSDDEQCMD